MLLEENKGNKTRPFYLNRLRGNKMDSKLLQKDRVCVNCCGSSEKWEKKKKFGLEELRNVELLNEGLFNLDLKGWKEFWWQYRGRRNVYQCV